MLSCASCQEGVIDGATVTLSWVAEYARHRLPSRRGQSVKVQLDAHDVSYRHVDSEDDDPHYAGDCRDFHDNDGPRVGHDRHGHLVRDNEVRDVPVCGP